MGLEDNKKSNPFRMTITDPEMIQKIRENGIESLSLDDLNSLGIEVKDGHMSVGDASQSDLSGTRRVRMRVNENEESGPSLFKRGIAGFIIALGVVFIVLITAGIIICKQVPDISVTYKDVIFLSLFFVVGFGNCLSGFHFGNVAKKYLTERVQGKCISHQYAKGNSFSKRSIFEYTYRGKVYRRHEDVFARQGCAEVGEVRELMIDPEDPRCIYDPIAGKARKISGVMIGMIFIVITAVVVVLI